MTDIDRQKCDEWLKARAKNWQVHRRGDWHYRWKGNTLVRYLDNVSMRELQDGLVLEYLTSDDCIPTLSLYSQDIDKSWKPVNAWYETQPMRPPNTGVAQVRLYHALKTDVDDSEGDGPYSVENGCMYKVDFRFYWKQTEVIDLPASSSGVNYRISNLNRDDEDGTFSYVLERRERVEQKIDKYLAETDSFKSRSRESVIGKKGDTSEGGKAASVNPSTGTIVTRTVRKNDDCTHDIDNDTIIEKSVTGSVVETRRTLRGKTVTTSNRSQKNKASSGNVKVGDVVRNELTEAGRWNTTITTHTPPDSPEKIRNGCTKTIFRHEHSETEVNATDPGFTHVSDVSGTEVGRIVEKTVTSNDEGTYDVSTTTKTDIEVKNAEVSVRNTISGVVTSVTDRNVANAVSTSDLPIGTRVTNRKTDSGLYDVTVEKAEKKDVGVTGEDCVRSAVEHRHSVTKVVADKPSSTEAYRVDNGTVVEKSVRVTDNGAFQVTDQTRRALSASASSNGGASKRSVSTTVYTNVPTSTKTSQPGVNLDVDVSKRVNEFGLLDMSETKVLHLTRQATASYGSPLVSEKLVETSHDTDGEASFDAEVGKTYNVSISQNESGSYEKRILERTANMKKWDVEVRTNLAFQYTIYFRNATVDEMHEIVRSMHEIAPSKVAEWNGAAGDPGLYRIDPSMSMNEFGLLDGNVVLRRGISRKWDILSKTDTFYSYIYYFRNLTVGEVKDIVENEAPDSFARLLPDIPGLIPKGKDGERYFRIDPSMGMNEYGLLDGNVNLRIGLKHKWDSVVDSEMSYMYTVYFRNFTKEDVENLVDDEFTPAVNAKMKGWSDAKRSPQSNSVHPSMNMNEYGLLDGSISYHAGWAAGTAGQTGDVDKVEFGYAYAATGEGSSRNGTIAAGRGIEALKEYALRNWTGNGSSLHVSISYNADTQRWTWNDSICGKIK